MKMKTLLITLIAGFSMLVLQSVYHLISDGGRHGPGAYELLKRCGEPTFRQGNTWVYEKGNKRYLIQFNDNGAITSINTL